MDDIIFFDYTRKSSLLLIFFFNALVFAALILRKGIQENKKDTYWLAAFLFLGALYLCPFMLGYGGWYGKQNYREFLFFMPFQQLFLIGPVFFFYIKSLVQKDFKLRSLDFLHFLPAIAYLLYSLVVLVGDKLVFEEFYFYADNQDKDLDFWYQMAGLISMLFYLYLSLRHYYRFRKVSLDEVSYADEIANTWIKNFSLAFGAILLLRVLFFILNPEWGEFGSKFWYYQCFALLLFYIAVSGYTNTIKESLGLKSNVLSEMDAPEPAIEESNSSSQNSKDSDQWKEPINELFEIKELHKNPDLTLSDVASQLNSNRNVISKAINQEFQMNFNDFVNEKRIKSIIELIEKGEHQNKTLLGLALDCGFNSKSTFNRAFKKYTGLNPKQYITKISA